MTIWMKRYLSILTALAVLTATAMPTIGWAAAKEKPVKQSVLDQTSRQYAVSVDFLQGELNKGYRLSEVRDALEAGKKGGKKYEAAIKEKAVRPVNRPDLIKPDVHDKSKTTEKQQKAAVDRFNAFTALSETDPTTDPSTALPEPNNMVDQAPYTVGAAYESVSTLTGSSFVRVTDLTLPGRNGLDFALTRSYDSNSSQLFEIDYTKTPQVRRDNIDHKRFNLGLGWKWEIPYVDVDSGYHFVHLPGGGTGTYQAVMPTDFPFYGYSWKDYEYSSSSSTTNSKLTSLVDGREYTFYQGELTKVTDTFGNYIDFSYTTDAAGNKWLSKIENNIGNSINIAYTDAEVMITSGEKTIRYVKGKLDLPDYPQQPVLKQVIDPAGRAVDYSYEARRAFSRYKNIPEKSDQNPYALLSSVRYPTGAYSHFVYPNPELYPEVDTQAVAENATELNDVFPVKEAYNEVVLSDGSKETYNHRTFTVDFVNYKTEINDDLGRKTIYQYVKRKSDTRGTFIQLTAKKTELEDRVVDESFTYSLTSDRPGTITRSVTMKADSSQTASTTQQTMYSEYGVPYKQIDALGNVSVFSYEQSSPLLKESVTYLKGSPDSTSGIQSKTTVLTRDPSNLYKITSMTVKDEAGKTLRSASYGYDAFGNVNLATVMNTGGQQHQTITEYSDLYKNTFPSRVSSQLTDVDGQTSTVSQEFAYDVSTGQATTHTDARGNVTTYSYDILGRFKTAVYPDASTVSIDYDDLNNQVTQTVRDESKDLVVKKATNKFNPLGWKLETGIYDENGTYQAKGKFGYDAYGRATEQEDALGNVTLTEYDAMDRAHKVTYSDGTATLQSYDDINLTQTVTDADGYSTRETMDKLGRTVKSEMITATGPVLLGTVTYDQVGNALTKTDAKGNVTKFQYNALSELTAVTDALGKTTSYTYDMRGNMTGITFPDNNTIQKQYNELGQLVKHTNEKGQVKKYYYDENSNLSKQIDYKGQMQTFAYDARNQLIEKASGSDTVSYAYDAAGRRTNRVDSIGTTEYAYTALDQLDTVVFPDGKTVSYGYDANGNRNRLTDPFGRDIFYKNDSRNRMESVSLGEPTETPEVSYAFTLGGRLDRETLRNGVVTQYGYDPRSRVESLVQTNAGGTALNTFGYGYDQNDNITSTTQNAQANQFTYDALNRIKTSSLNMEEYGYDDRNNRATLQSEKDLLETGAEYEYDQWNRLVSATTLDGKTVAYKYTGDGLLYERAENGTVTRFYYDGQALLAEADVTNGEPVLKTRYVGGSDLAMQEDANGTKAYYLQNAHGDIVSLLDSASNVLNRYEYDIWGQPMVADEQVNNSLLFAGEFWDHTLSLQYLRARWYDPSQGRFLNEDTFEGKYDSPFTQNLYAYVLHNPLKYQDPTGHFCQSRSNGEIDGMWAHWGDCSNSGSLYTSDSSHNASELRMNGYLPKARIILVTGINSSADRMNPLGDLLNDAQIGAYRPVNLFSGGLLDGALQVHYTAIREDNIKTGLLAGVLNDEYGKWHDDVEIIIIAHSGGGVQAVNATNQVNGKRPGTVDRVITIGGAERQSPRGAKYHTISADPDIVRLGAKSDKILSFGLGSIDNHSAYFDPAYVYQTYQAVRGFIP